MDDGQVSTCVICLETIVPGSAAKADCGHTFCVGCILRWLEINPACPCCKSGPILRLDVKRHLDGTFRVEYHAEPVVLLRRAAWCQSEGKDITGAEQASDAAPDTIETDHDYDWDDEWLSIKAAHLSRSANRQVAEAWGLQRQRPLQPRRHQRAARARVAAKTPPVQISNAEKGAINENPTTTGKERGTKVCARKQKKARQKAKLRARAQAQELVNA